jgi:hypothetical protein
MTISSDDIETHANAPKRVRTEEGTVEERSVDELIKADRYAREGTANTVPYGIRVARVRPGGAA